jgi:hypothetical protein
MSIDEDLKKERGKDSHETESMKMSEMPYQINNSEPILKHDLVEGLMVDIMTNISQNTTALTDHDSSMMNEEDNMDVEAIFEDTSAFNIAVTESDDDGDGDDEDGVEGVPSAPKNKDKTKWSEEEVSWKLLK